MSTLEISDRHQIKGTALKNLKNFLDRRFERGLFERYADRSELLGRSGVVLLSQWYSARRIIEMEMDIAKLLGLSVRDFFIDYGCFTVEEDLNGVYRSFMRLGGAERVLSSVPTLSKAYVNYMDAAVVLNQRGLHRSQFILPESLTEIALFTNEGASRGILNVCNRRLETFRIVESTIVMSENERYTKNLLEITYD
jgi:hypothetical protein